MKMASRFPSAEISKFLVTLLVIILITILFLSSLNSQINAHAEFCSSIDIFPSPVRISIVQGSAAPSLNYTIQLCSGKELKDTVVRFSDLYSEEDSRLVIPSSIFSLNESEFDLPPLMTKSLKIGLDVGNRQDGNYTGRLMVTSNNSSISTPIYLKISTRQVTLSDFPQLPIVIVSLGVITSFFVYYLQFRIERRELALASMERVMDSLRAAFNENRSSERGITFGGRFFNDAIKEFTLGNYLEATKKFDKAKEFFDRMETSKVLKFQLPLRKYEDAVSAAKMVSPLFSRLNSSASLYYVLQIVLLIIAIVITWQGVSSEILEFDNAFADGIAAFILGFGSQALVQQVLPLMRRELTT